MWRNIKRLKLKPKEVPYATYLRFKTIFSGDDAYGRINRHGAIEFQHRSCTSIGIIESILVPNYVNNQSWIVLLLGLLTSTPPDQGNSKVVYRYVNVRYKYDLSPSNIVRSVAIQMCNIAKPVMIVLDPFWVAQHYSVTMRLNDVPEDGATHTEMWFS